MTTPCFVFVYGAIVNRQEILTIPGHKDISKLMHIDALIERRFLEMFQTFNNDHNHNHNKFQDQLRNNFIDLLMMHDTFSFYCLDENLFDRFVIYPKDFQYEDGLIPLTEITKLVHEYSKYPILKKFYNRQLVPIPV